MNDADFSKCKFSSGIVPYMYGEMSGSESSSFESHLLECSMCTDEFASISSARYEVYEWKKLEFDPLATPQIEIVFDTESTVSWTDKLRAVFAQSWAIPSMAAAGILIAAIFATTFLLSEKGSSDVAANFARDTAVDESGTQSSPGFTSTEVGVGSDSSEAREPEPRVVRSAAPQRVSQKHTARTARSITIKAASAQNDKKAPRLNEFVEEEDTSVRLAELFDDIETSE
jgi:hypothetical protein